MEFAGKANRSEFVVKATRKELRRIQLLQAIKEAAGAWKDEDHPDLVEKGTCEWVREQRQVPDISLKQIETGKEV